MIQRRYETIVGIFVVASLAALLAMVLIVAQQEGLFQRYVTYRAVFRNISGLRTGSEVHLAGVTVGNVTDTVIDPEGNIVVTFRVLQKYSDRIRQDSRATIGFMGLLGDKSLDLSSGSPHKPPIPPDSIVASIEPLDITQLLARAAPSLEDLQKILTSLVAVTQGISEPGSTFDQTVSDIRSIIRKIEQGKGSLGMLVNEGTLYRDTTETMAHLRKFVSDLEKSKGLFGTVLNDPAFKAQALKAMADLHASLGNLHMISRDLKEALACLPDMAKKLDGFLTNLDKAGKGLPGLVTQGEATLSDVDRTNKAAQQSWLLRRYVPRPQEHTIRMDADPGKE